MDLLALVTLVSAAPATCRALDFNSSLQQSSNAFALFHPCLYFKNYRTIACLYVNKK
jgi:hypothetical protein